MYFSSLLRAMRRHWYVVLSGLLSTAMLCVAAASFVPPDYEAQASLLLLPARTTAGGDNPLLAIGGLQPTADTIARAMTDSGVQLALFEAGATGQYEVLLDPISKGPVLLVTATDSTPEAAMTTLRLVAAQVPLLLADLQKKLSVPTRARLSTMVIAEDRQAQLVLKSRIRLLGAVAGLGLALTFGLLVFLGSRDRQMPFAWLRRATPSDDEPAVPPRAAANGGRSRSEDPHRPPGGPRDRRRGGPVADAAENEETVWLTR